MIELLKSIWPVLLILGLIIVSLIIPDSDSDSKSKSTDVVDRFLKHKFKTPPKKQ
jgi:hypothetical protein